MALLIQYTLIFASVLMLVALGGALMMRYLPDGTAAPVMIVMVCLAAVLCGAPSSLHVRQIPICRILYAGRGPMAFRLSQHRRLTDVLAARRKLSPYLSVFPKIIHKIQLNAFENIQYTPVSAEQIPETPAFFFAVI